VNGQPVLIRGGGWSSDMLLRLDPQRLETEMRYVRDMGLNTIRLEGKLEHDTFYELADRYGILVIAGWCCCDHWEEWQNWDGEDHWVAAESLRDQALRLRNHPSVLAWLNGSDNPPPADVERAYLAVLREAGWPKPVVSNATDKPSTTGASGVKMRGPYDYVPPSYWLEDSKLGGAHGFATEITGGMAVPPVESMKAILPRASWWPMDEVWRYHAGSQEFADMDLYNQALAARYGAPTSLEDYTRKAQAMAYEAHRAMFEGYARNKYRATGVIQWMLNNAWPSLIWHLYDYSLRPAGAYYGAKKACRPLHVQYSYDDRSVVVVDDRHREARGLKVTATLLDLALKPRLRREAVVDVPADGVVRAFVLPEAKDLTATYFLKLDLSDADGRAVGSNFYWLSTRPDLMQWDKSTWFHTPVTQHGDLSGVTRLPATQLRVSARFEAAHAEPSGTVTVENTGHALAFMVRLKASERAGGEEVLPVIWEDNYFELMPGEKREISVSFPQGKAASVVEAEAWNARLTTAK
jgi:exo-1,4-beta-D-glucosaminidase